MSQRKYDHLVSGISAYPDLENRLAAELRWGSPNNGSCSKCKMNTILRKYKNLVDIRRKKEPPRRY